MSEVLDRYGNNVAVQCPACDGVFVVSLHLNQVSGRICPHCQRGRATISGNEIRLELVKSKLKRGLEDGRNGDIRGGTW